MAKPTNRNSMQTAFLRFMLVVAFFIFWIGAVSVRLVHLQVKEHEKWSKKASSQQQDKVVTKSLRGSIYDRNGNALAMSVRVKSLAVDPVAVDNPLRLTEKLSTVLRLNAKLLAQEITDAKINNRRFLWIERELDEEKAAKIKAEVFEDEVLGEEFSRGLHWVGEQKREYPHGTLAAHIIGFSNADDIGQAGIEKAQEAFLKAEQLKTVRHRDRQGRVFSEIDIERTPAKDVAITISKEIQHIAERAVERGVKAVNAKSGKAIVMDPKNGEILAMVNYPTFDPAQFRTLKPGTWRNSAIQDQYAPGSIFKLVTYSSAIEEGLVDPNGMVDCGSGTITVGGYTFRDSHGVGNVSYANAFAQSSNVGAIKTGQLLGREKYYEYAKNLGFGQATGVGLPSEADGVLRKPETWQGTDLASISIGYGVDVTAMQSTVAFATIANDGVRVQPHIVKNVQQDGDILESFESESQQVMKPETARAMKRMMQEVVEDGTAKRARLNGYTSAGKTGTAWKYDRELGKINSDKYVSSFIGFAPADNPAVVITVVIDEPKGGARNGGQVAAPVFREIAESILPELKIPSDGTLIDDASEASLEGDTVVDAETPVDPAAATPTEKAKPELETKTETKSAARPDPKAATRDKEKKETKPKNEKEKKPKKGSSKALDARLDGRHKRQGTGPPIRT